MKKRSSDKWLMKIKDRNYIESLKREDLVYLSGDAEEDMEEYDSSKVYIIGGLVDHNQLKNVTLEKSKEMKIKSLRFPIRKYMKVVGSQILSVNQSFEILLRLHNGEGWKEALGSCIPKRKAVPK